MIELGEIFFFLGIVHFLVAYAFYEEPSFHDSNGGSTLPMAVGAGLIITGIAAAVAPFIEAWL
jgi:hypothetical protein